MKHQGGWWRGVSCGLLLAAALGNTGCLTFLHPVRPPESSLVQCCKAAPSCSRGHVYVFLINGLDPPHYANLTGVRDYVQSLGFGKTYFGEFFHARKLAQEIRRIHQEDPCAKFVLIGFSWGANKAALIAQEVRPDGVTIDLLVYLGGNTLQNRPEDRPENACRTVNILAKGYLWNGAVLDGAENVQLNDTYHFGSPTHQSTLEMLARELAAVAETVPVLVSAMPPSTMAPEEAPTPRPVRVQPTAPRHAWDFLKPVSRLREALPPAPADSTSEATPPPRAIARRDREAPAGTRNNS